MFPVGLFEIPRCLEKLTMKNMTRWTGVMAVSCLAILGGSASPANAQGRMPFGYAGPYRGSNYYIAPGLTIGQAAYNTAAVVRAASSYPPYTSGYNPYAATYNSAASPYTPSGSSYINPYAGGYGSSYVGTTTTAGYGTNSSSTGSNPYTANADPYGGFLRGSAEVVSSQGKLEIDLQKANVTREQARQAHIDTRRRLFDEIMYERAHTPSYNDIQEKRIASDTRRAQLSAPITEVWSGRSLNDLLNDAARLYGKDVFGPRIDLDLETLKQINVVGGSKVAGNIGILRDEGRLAWPIGLKELKPVKGMEETPDEIREFLNRKARTAVEQAVNGAVAAGMIKDMRSAVAKLYRALAKNVNKLPTADYIEAKRFLNNFDEAITILTRPDLASYFNQTYTAKGKTVRDLINYMTKKGLAFAPAVAGDEAAYQALYQALAAYDLGANRGMRTTARNNSRDND
jgi:hypothetical protein